MTETPAPNPDPALAGIVAPVDPRLAHYVPTFGKLPVVGDLDELTSRVIAPNPSHMTLDGTDTYIVGLPGSGAAVVVDPGPEDREHKSRVDAALLERDAECAWIVVTHHHRDHSAAAQTWASAFGCRVAAPTREVAGDAGRVIGDGDAINAGGMRIDAVATPGHCHDHTAFRLPNGAVLTGDHILGRGTSVVAFPEGSLVSYLDSLRKVLDLGPRALYPGHGPEMTGDDPGAVVRYYISHRAFRERQVLAVLGDGPHEPAAIVERVYADVDKRLWGAAQMSTRAALAKLKDEGRVAEDSGTFRLA